MASVEYTITDSPEPYVHAQFLISPAYCPLTYSYEETVLSNGQSALTLPINNDRSTQMSYMTLDALG